MAIQQSAKSSARGITERLPMLNEVATTVDVVAATVRAAVLVVPMLGDAALVEFLDPEGAAEPLPGALAPFGGAGSAALGLTSHTPGVCAGHGGAELVGL